MISSNLIASPAETVDPPGLSESIVMLANEDVKRFLVSQTQTIRHAMEQLEISEEKIIFVVDPESRLVGTLTDGDIRRWILSDGDLKASTIQVCNCRPYVVEEGFSAEQIRAEMVKRNLSCVPVINSNREVIRLIFWKEFFHAEAPSKVKQRLDLPVVIMAGGKGTRLAPFTNVLPKPLIPIGDRTIIEIIIDKFLPYGLSQFHISINYKSRILKSFFEELAPSYSVGWVEETEPLGTAGSLRVFYKASAESIIVTNCDIVIQADFAELESFHRVNAYDLTIVASVKNYNIPYGVCELEKGGTLARIAEKPQYNFLVNTGMYLVRRNRLNLIPENTRFDMTDFIARLKEAGGRIGVFPIGEHAWIDTGEWTEYRKALSGLERFIAPAATE